MIEIIPNWHPTLVHFTVALVTISVGFYLIAYLMSRFNAYPRILSSEFEIVARWCLWVGALFTIATVLAGLYAFYTVRHDETSHMAMLEHRNWALPTAVFILIAAAWSLRRFVKKEKDISLTFLLALLLVQGALISTAWHGGELVYRYGLGVMSLPATEAEPGHYHHHEADE